MKRSLTWLVLVLVSVGCQSTEPGPSLRRLRVRAPVAARALPALDRDTQTRVTLSAPVTFTIELTGGTRLRELKLHSPRAIELSALGHSSRHAEVTGWTTLNVDLPLPASSVTITLTPLAAEGSLGELEFWGEGAGSVGEEPPTPIAGSNLVVVPSRYAEATLTPKSTADGNSCSAFEFSHDVLTGDVRRAWLTWVADGAAHVEALKVSVNDAPLREALWLEASGTHPMREELDPRTLVGLNETTHLCLPETATKPVAVREVRLLLAVDDGAHWFDRETSHRLSKTFDGDTKTSDPLPAGGPAISLERTISLDQVALGFESAAPTLELGVGPANARHTVTMTAGPLLTLKKVGGVLTREVSLTANGALRADLPLATASELVLLGSPEGSPLERPELVLVHPSSQRPASDGLHVAHYDGAALVSGWAISSAGSGRVTLDDAVISSSTGAFSVAVRRPVLASEPWRSTLRATYPDGVIEERTLIFDVDLKDTVGTQGVTVAPDSVLFGAENQTASALIGPAGGAVTLGERVGFSAPPGALATPTSISITRAMPEVVPKLDPGMVNVTAPANAGYRFGPKGQQFAVPVRITLPFDARLLPEGMSVTEIQTWYFDEATERWAALTRKDVLHATSQLVSETTHFTFMINAVLVTPEHAEPASFNPTSLKDLKAASPTEGLDLVELSDPGNQGTARLQLPIRLPKARGDFQPQVALTYDSSAGNGYMGVGWSLSASSITLDTRFGVPGYDGSERYLLDGAALVATGGPAPCRGGLAGLRFARRVESDFALIVRCGTTAQNYHFEITNKSGVRFVYGPDATTRLTSYLNANIAEWHLAEVSDRNGNTTRYFYDIDRRASGDAQNGEDFRFVYPKRVEYGGTGSNPFVVEFRAQTAGQLVAPRPDPSTSARYGFKTVQRRRLGSVSVKFGGQIIREYALAYQAGDFGKSILSKVQLFGEGGVAANHLFSTHGFDYSSSANAGFTFEEWSLPDDPDRLSASTEVAFGVHGYVGVGWSSERSAGAVGLRLGFNHREQTTRASFVDLNGDRIPDRLTKLGVALGDSTQHRFSSTAPAGDPASGQFVSPYVGVAQEFQLPGLGKEVGNAFNAAVQFQLGEFNANLGGSVNFTDSSEFLYDTDGDGLIDYVGNGGVLFNQPRGADCNPRSFCFDDSKRVTSPTFANLDGGGLLSHDLTRSDAGAQALAKFTPNDALVEWIAPFKGVVDVSGALRYARPQPSVSPGRDGVRLRVYSSSVRDGGTLADLQKPYGDATPSPVAFSGLSVDAGDHLYFRLSTGADFPVQMTPDGGKPLEEVSFSPRIEYRCSTPGCQSIITPTGSPLYTSDLSADLRMAGRPPLVVQAARTGTIQVTWTVLKPVMQDQLRLCVIRYPLNSQFSEKSCDESNAFEHAVIPAGTVGSPFTQTATFPVTAGEQLVFRAETRLAVDVRGVSAQVSGLMTHVCVPPDPCRTTTAEEQRYLSFSVDAQVPVHADTSVLPPLSNGAFEGFEIPEAGELTVVSASIPVQVCTVVACTPITFAVRTKDRILTSRTEGSDGGTISSATIPVQRGERLFVEAHSEVAEGLVPDAVLNLWNVTATLRVAQPDGGVKVTQLSDSPAFQKRRTYDRIRDLNDVLAQRSGTRVDDTVLSGGYQGWHYGVWGAQPDEPLDLDLLEGKTPPFVAPDTTNDAGLRDLRNRSRDPESYERRRARLLGVMLPKPNGTLTWVALPDGGVERGAGLKPDVAAFVSTDSSAWVAADGTWHAARKGGFIESGKTTTSVEAVFDVGRIQRSSLGLNASTGIGFGPLSSSLSIGSTEQSLDMLDMNGDGIIDVVGRDGIRLTNRNTLRGEPLLTPDAGLLRTNDDLGVSLGLGISTPVGRVSSKGDNRGLSVAVSASLGGGLGVNLGVSRGELMDLNGDGLPDLVQRRGDDIVVRLNLGGKFANEDKYFVGNWTTTTGGTEGFVRGLTPDPVDSGDDAGVADRGVLAELISTLTTEEQLRRSVTASFNANLGFTFQENYGVSANVDTSLSGTEVSMIDVTGDGLPDYVRRNPRPDGGVSSMLVKVNLGGSFSSERELPLPAWPAQSGPNFVFPNVANTAVTDAMKSLLGAGGESLLEANGAHTRIPGFGFVVTIPIPLTIFNTPYLFIGVGADVSPERASGFEMGFVDIDGDGFADHVLKTDAKENPNTQATREKVFVRRNEMGGGNLLRTVRRPLGGRINVEYARAGNTVAMPESRWVLLRTTMDDGTNQAGAGHQLRTAWSFTNGVFDRAEREFLGFTQVKSTTADRTSVTRTFDTSGVERRGLLEQQETRDVGGQLLLATVNQYHPLIRPTGARDQRCIDTRPFFLDEDAYCSTGFVGLKSVETRQFEGQAAPKVSRQSYQYDGFGNVTQFVDEGDIATTEDDHTATVSYLTSTAPYLVGLPTSISVHAGLTPTGPLLRKRDGVYDGKGNLTSLLSQIDGANTAETTLRWHPNGNLLSVQSPPNETGQRYSVTYAYDMATQTWPSVITDSFGYSSTSTYSPEHGQVLSTTDINGQTTTRTVDFFGRVTSVTGPRERLSGRPTIAIKYLGTVAVTANLLPDGTGRTGQLEVATFVDGFGRARQTKTTARVENLGVGMTVSGAQEFDVLGRVVAQGQPVFSRDPVAQFSNVRLVRPTRFTFDSQGRTTSATEPNGAFTRIDYSLEAPPTETLPRLATLTTDARGKRRTAYRDPGGRVVAVTENFESRTLTTRYTHSPIGELLTVADAAGNTTRMTYDLLGRRLSLDNPDTGLHTSTYDLAGNLTAQTTPRLRASGVPIKYVYDYNRLARIDYPASEDIVYVYGDPGALNGGAGRVIEVHDAVGSEKREYGPLGEITKQTRTVRPLRPGDRPREFTLGFEWDSFGRALKVQYPDGEVLSYAYDEGGLLRRAAGTRGAETEVYLADVGYNEFGERIRAEYGNGVVTTSTHEPASRRLSTLTSKLSTATGGTTFQALTYGYDPVGNVTSLTNALPSAISTPFGGAVSYQYGYDDLNRLATATGQAASRPGVDDTFTAGWKYSDVHNITQATLVRQVTSMNGTQRPPGETRDEAYAYEALHPHRARTIGTLQLEYDEDGNTIRECEGSNCPPGRGSVYAWDEEGRMSEANAKGRLVRFRYDADGQRMVKLAAGGPTFTFGQWWTMSGNSHATKHVFAGGNRVATKMLPAATVQANTPPGGGAGTGWPNTNGCIPSGNQPQKCPANANGTAWLERGVAKPATWYYHSDSLGSTQWLTDDEGKLHERVEYFPYGEVWRQSSGQGANRLRQAFLYTGKEYDSETGLTYFGARYFDARHARWLSPDPALGEYVDAFSAQSGALRSHLLLGGNLALYGYGLHNPSTLKDGDGRIVWVFIIVGLAIAVGNHESESRPGIPAGAPALMGMAAPPLLVLAAAQHIKSGTENLGGAYGAWSGGDEETALRLSEAAKDDFFMAGGEAGGAWVKGGARSALKADVTKRPGSFRKGTVKDAWESAADGPQGGKLCPTCGKEVTVRPGKGTREAPRDWDVDHQPPWSKRDLTGLTREQILDLYNKGTRLECPTCNRSRGATPAE